MVDSAYNMRYSILIAYNDYTHIYYHILRGIPPIPRSYLIVPDVVVELRVGRHHSDEDVLRYAPVNPHLTTQDMTRHDTT
jgi:hypothetical protein